MTTGPDPGCAGGGDGQKRRDDVDDKAPLLMGLKAVKNYEGEVGEEYVEDLRTEVRNSDGEWSEYLIGQWVEKETGKCGSEVVKEWRGAPI